MYSLRTSLSLLVSGVVHTSLVVVLASRTVATYLPVNTFAPVEILPPPTPKEPVEPPPPPQPSEPPAKAMPETRVRSLQPTSPRQQPPTPSSPQPLAPQTPVALAGLSFSNVGIALPQGNGSGGRTEANPIHSRRVVEPATVTGPAELTSLSDLSRKPSPPALDAALARHYPVHLRTSGIEGQALVRVIVGRAGEVRTTTLLSETHQGFGSACQKALEKSRWGPPIDQAGNTTSTSLQYRCRFTVGL